MASIEKYKIPRAQVDVEAMAQEIFRYLRISSEDTEFLSYDPTLRDSKIAELYANPACKPSMWPKDIVGPDPLPEQVDEYLSQANAAIEALTPPKDFGERVMRGHIAIAALLVYQEYKCKYGLQGYHELRTQVVGRSTALMDEWFHNEYPRLFPDRAARFLGDQATSTPPTHQAPLGPPAARDEASEAEAIATLDVDEYLKIPHTLLCKRFKHSPPSGQLQDYKGIWEMESYTTRMREERVDHEFLIMLEACNGATIPMDRGEVRFLLQYSTVVS